MYALLVNSRGTKTQANTRKSTQILLLPRDCGGECEMRAREYEKESRVIESVRKEHSVFRTVKKQVKRMNKKKTGENVNKRIRENIFQLCPKV